MDKIQQARNNAIYWNKKLSLLESNRQEKALDEKTYISSPSDILTVKDLIEYLEQETDLDDRLVIRNDKKTQCAIKSIKSVHGMAIIDIVPANVSVLEDEEDCLDEIEDDIDEGDDDMNESYHPMRNYGGYGRSYHSYSVGGAPIGRAISFYPLTTLEPSAIGKVDSNWRMGPTNFPFSDFLYPERKYKIGTTVMINKNVKDEGKTVYISIPSYFDAIKNNDSAALEILAKLGLPLNMTFGMNPADDYSGTYTLR